MSERSIPRSAFVKSAIDARPRFATLVDALEAAAADGGPYVTFHSASGARALDYRAALEGAGRWARTLRNAGIARGDRVAVLLPTGPAFVTALLGTMLAGAIPVPLAAPLTFGKVDRYLANLARILIDADARVLVTYPRIVEAIGAASSRLPPLSLLTEADLATRAADDPRGASLSARDTALLQYTSGTTGDPKGVVVSHGALLSNAFAIAEGLALGANDVGVSWLPLFHDMGLIGVMVTAIAHPFPIHVTSPESFVMRPARWLDLVARVGGTLTCAPNFGYELVASRAAEFAGGSLSAVRLLLNGAEPVSASTAAKVADRFAPHGLRADAMLPVYGMAECTLAVTFPSLASKLETLSREEAPTGAAAVSVGAPVAGTSIAIVDEQGRTLPERSVGEIRVSGASLMDGYFRNERASADALIGGWLRSGDMGFVDGGRLFVTGRLKEVIIQAGRNVHAPDVERVVLEASGARAAAAAAFARPNAERGTDDLIVLVESAERDGDKRAALARDVRGEVLAALGVRIDEVRICPIGAAPRTTSGKLRRRACADVAAERPEP